MAAHQFSEHQVDHISRLLARYIVARRETLYPQASPLNTVQTLAMSNSFTRRLLEAVRLVVMPGFRFEDPEIYRLLARLKHRPDFARISAITFQDVIVSCGPFTDSLLFHELVHAEQYYQLGVARFAELYVRGFPSSETYTGIPLEVHAYQLEAQFRSTKGEAVRVADEVAAWDREGRL